ncbi:MAG: hypothetical protein O3A51_12225 [Verrucomicrobia bacterium]|nr:hypothetical protein [Verrucomicrobiota bacterium]
MNGTTLKIIREECQRRRAHFLQFSDPRCAQRDHQRGQDPSVVVHVLNRIVFCRFAENTELLPDGIFTKITSNPTGDRRSYFISCCTRNNMGLRFQLLRMAYLPI